MPDHTTVSWLRPHQHIRATLTAQGGMLLDLRGRGRWFALTPSAALWWRHVQEGASPSEAAAAIAERYSLTTEQVDHDLQPFIDEVLQRRLLSPVNSRRWWPW